ncbi:hypothetical protein EYZ11_010846 [Aspergillus tanneri]|uniref:PBP domain-containing protein n=1 Tax=Aspergillus tanneri TaxID=1220188 RepID=A0A4V3UN40_9EURO|nr:hypothetical protein EYZ11_010846 [Aspergillus tanneri]
MVELVKVVFFINSKIKDCDDPKVFRVGWVKGDTTQTINNLKEHKIDIGITYHQVAEQNAIGGGFAKGCNYERDDKEDHKKCYQKPCFDSCTNPVERPCSTFTDHFYLVGPKENPAKIDPSKDDITTTFRKIYEAGERGEVRFLTRFDKSATNIKDSEMWIGIGQVYSDWYHQYIAFPVEALTEAIKQGEYTITDRGTFLTLMSSSKDLTDNTTIYRKGENCGDPLLNPADIIVSGQPLDSHKPYMDDFVRWVHDSDGQAVIRNYIKPPQKYCFYNGFDLDLKGNCTWDLDAPDIVVGDGL